MPTYQDLPNLMLAEVWDLQSVFFVCRLFTRVFVSISSPWGATYAFIKMRSLGTAQTFSRSGQAGVLARGALISAVYRRAMVLSGKSRGKSLLLSFHLLELA